MEQSFSRDIVFVFNTLFPLKRAIAEMLWNANKEAFSHQRDLIFDEEKVTHKNGIKISRF